MKLFTYVYSILFLTTTCTFPLSHLKEKYREELVENSTRQVSFSSIPSWIKEVDYETENYEQNIDEGIAHLLANRQYNLEERVNYIREVNKIVSKEALTEACRIPISFNFQNEDLIIHNIKIIRDGDMIDKLATAKRKYFYPSSGNITEVFFYIDNLHIGDIIDVSYSLRYKDNCILYHLLGDEFNMKGASFYKKIAYRCLVEKDKPFLWKTHLFEQDPVCTLYGTHKEYSWEIDDYNIQLLPVGDFPKRSCFQSIRTPSITISTNQWGDIARYCTKLLKEKSHFFPDPPQNIVELIQEWQNIYPNKEEQILAAIRMVSDDIYYVSIPDEEEHSITPYSPNETLQNHYGDCKDKTSLLIALLKLLDVEAHPVLVNTEKTYELRNELPNPRFDHLITNIEYDGKSYFIDPTLSLLGGNLDTYQIPDYGYGLIVKEDSEDLIPITRNFLSKVQSAATVRIQEEEIKWDHAIQFCHNEADVIRKKLIPGYPDNQRAKNILDYINNQFPDGEVIYTSPLQIEDNRGLNIITNKFSLSIKNPSKPSPKGIFYDLTPIIGEMMFFPTDKMDFSTALSLETIPGFNEEIYRTVDIHCNMPPNLEEKKVHYIDENISYKMTLEKISEMHVRVTLHQKFFTNYIEADQLPHFCEKLQEFQNHLSLKIEIPT